MRGTTLQLSTTGPQGAGGAGARGCPSSARRTLAMGGQMPDARHIAKGNFIWSWLPVQMLDIRQ